jgi:hypothetical protein
VLNWFVTLRKDHRLTMVENRVMRKMFGPKRDEETVEEENAYKDFYDLYTSPNIIRTIKSRKIRWSVMRHVWGRRQERQRFWWKNLKEITWKMWV